MYKIRVCAEVACWCVCSFPVSSSGLLWSFLYWSLQLWQICCCSAHLIIINTDPPLPQTHTHSNKHIGSQRDHPPPPLVSYITTFFSPILPTKFIHPLVTNTHSFLQPQDSLNSSGYHLNCFRLMPIWPEFCYLAYKKKYIFFFSKQTFIQELCLNKRPSLNRGSLTLNRKLLIMCE